MNLNSLSIGDLQLLRDTLDAVEPLMRLAGATLDLTATEPKIALPVFPAATGLPRDIKIKLRNDYFPFEYPIKDAVPLHVVTDAPEPEADHVADAGKMIEPAPEPAPAPQSKPEQKPEPAKTIGAAWSAEEDDLLIALRVELGGRSFYACAHEAQKRLAVIGSKRTADAIAYRMKCILRQRINEALDEAKKAAPGSALEPKPAPETPVDMVIPISKPTPQPATRRLDNLPIWQRHMRVALDQLGYENDWTPEDDLRMAEMVFGQGWKLGAVADALERDHASVNARWQALAAIARDGKDRMSLDDQAHLAVELRARVSMARTAMAGE